MHAIVRTPRLTAIVAALLLSVGLVLVPAPADATVSLGSRLVGASEDPTIASITMSRDAFGRGEAAGIVLARDDVFADSLAGAALAGTDRPILYTTGGAEAELRPEILTETRRVVGAPQGCQAAPDGEVLILGGVAAVSQAAEDALADDGYCVRRFGGAGRVETSLLILDELLDNRDADATRVLMARADSFADAATGGAYAAFAGLGLIVNPSDALHPAVEATLQARGFDEVILLGGTAALGEQVAQEAAAFATTVSRSAGSSRDGTAAAIARDLWDAADVRGVTLVDGFTDDAFVFAIGSAVIAAKEATPQLYINGDLLPEPTAEYMRELHGVAAFAGDEPATVGPITVFAGRDLREAVIEAIEGAEINSGLPVLQTLFVICILDPLDPFGTAREVVVNLDGEIVNEIVGPTAELQVGLSTDGAHDFGVTTSDAYFVVDTATGEMSEVFAVPAGEQIIGNLQAGDDRHSLATIFDAATTGLENVWVDNDTGTTTALPGMDGLFPAGLTPIGEGMDHVIAGDINGGLFVHNTQNGESVDVRPAGTGASAILDSQEGEQLIVLDPSGLHREPVGDADAGELLDEDFTGGSGGQLVKGANGRFAIIDPDGCEVDGVRGTAEECRGVWIFQFNGFGATFLEFIPSDTSVISAIFSPDGEVILITNGDGVEVHQIDDGNDAALQRWGNTTEVSFFGHEVIDPTPFTTQTSLDF